jgi:hypothetical protein
MLYEVLSPDGISINRRRYRTEEKAVKELELWVKRYEFQGFYSTARWERIPLEDLAGRCRIIQVQQGPQPNAKKGRKP